MIADRRLALLIAVWTLFTWGGRVGLLTGDEEAVAKVRIGMSLLLAVGAVVALTADVSWRRPGLIGYAVGVFVVWGSSLVSVLTDPTSSTAFRLVHSVLAFGSMVLATLALSALRRSEPAPGRRLGAHERADR